MKPGTTPYTIIRRLGNGGMADVFLAQDVARGGRLVALKRMRDTAPEMLVHFAREARIGALLAHPHVVQVVDAGQDAEGPFIALEFVDGLSASELMRFYARQRMPLPLELWCVLAHDVVAGLHHAHCTFVEGDTDGVLHRDLSPDNVLVSREGLVKLSDFGLASMPGDTRVTRTGTIKGKLAYLAPELIDGAAPSTASDVYALGVTLFKLAAGMAPFRGNNDGELLRAILSPERPALSALRPDVPPTLTAWVQQAIAPRPEERPKLKSLLKLLPPVDGAPRLALAHAVVAACTPDGSPAPSSREGALYTQRLKPRLSESAGASTEPTESVASSLPPARGDTEPTESVASSLPPARRTGLEPTGSVLSSLPVPPSMEPTGSVLSSLPVPRSAEPTERLTAALPWPREEEGESTERLPPAAPVERKPAPEPQKALPAERKPAPAPEPPPAAVTRIERKPPAPAEPSPVAVTRIERKPPAPAERRPSALSEAQRIAEAPTERRPPVVASSRGADAEPTERRPPDPLDMQGETSEEGETAPLSQPWPRSPTSQLPPRSSDGDKRSWRTAALLGLLALGALGVLGARALRSSAPEASSPPPTVAPAPVQATPTQQARPDSPVSPPPAPPSAPEAAPVAARPVESVPPLELPEEDVPARTPRPSATPPARTAPVPRGPGRLVLKVVPWAEVFVDSEHWGVTPLKPRELPPGRHTVLLINNALGVRHVQSVQVEPGQDVTVAINLARTPPEAPRP